ncbi:MAG TPA: DUF4398 domain-containing protein [Gallionella sp.]|nr:DUF4398 domain-containing protein [Gallionella sp.]
MNQSNRFKSFQLGRIGTTIAALALIAGCASTHPAVPAPTEQLAVSRAAISTANSAGGSEYAPIQFKSALEKMADAERAMGEKNYVRARLLAEQAQVDAELASAAAGAAKAKKSADAVNEDNRVLRNEIDRNAK